MITKVHTLNSIYEIDWDQKLVRRVQGESEPTPRFSPEGEWKPYITIVQCKPHSPFVIQWPDGQPELRDLTVSSNVLALEEPWLFEGLET